MQIDLTGRVALVTGGARGIGHEIAVQLATAGAHTVIADVDPGGSDRASELAATGLPVSYTPIDTADEESVERAVSEIAGRVGAPHILVNNAGVTMPAPTLETSKERWDKVLGINLTGPFLCARACLPGMREAQWGRIVNLSSFNAKSAPVNGDNISYAASKAGLTGLVHNLAIEFGHDSVTVNGIAPGIVDTELLRSAHPPERRAELKKRIPTGRFTTPADIAALAVFLSSDLAGSINGEIVNVNGGLYLDS